MVLVEIKADLSEQLLVFLILLSLANMPDILELFEVFKLLLLDPLLEVFDFVLIIIEELVHHSLGVHVIQYKTTLSITIISK